MNQEFEFENRTVSMYLHRWFETPITDTANVYNVCRGTRLEWLLTNGDQLRSRLFTMRSLARTPEEHAALQETEKRAESWIRWLLEQNREKIRLYQQQGVKDSRLFVMLDPQGSPRDAAFEGFAEELSPENGKPGCVPRYTDGCMPRFCYDFQEALQDRPLFDAWLPPELPDGELLAAAKQLQSQGRLGEIKQEIHRPTDYTMKGMTREQRDAQAWQNWANENNIREYEYIDLDKRLNSFIHALEQEIAFYELVSAVKL